ncbi:viral A-type inclusion protein, partial [Reticulomyxa filosa]
VYQALFVCTLWKEWDMKQYLSVKQLLVAIKILAKEKLPPLSVVEVLEHNLSIFDTTNAPVSQKIEKRSRCTPFEKLMLIPCFNYLVLIGHKELSFSQSVQKIDFGSGEKCSINEMTLKEVLILDLHLRRNNQSSPKIHIEKHLINLLQYNLYLADAVVKLLLDNTNFDTTTKTNLWERLWNFEKCWPIFQSSYELRFHKWDTLIAEMQQVNKQQKKKGVSFCMNRWKDKASIISTIELFCDNNKVENQGLVRIADNENMNERLTLTNKILQLFLKDKENRTFWITLLATSDTISTHNNFLKSLQDSLNDWLYERGDENKVIERIPLHSKVLELVSSNTFENAKLYHRYLIEIANENYRELWLSNKKWTSEEINICAKVKWELWPQVIKNIDNIPDIEGLDEKNMESINSRVCSNLDYCFDCQLWFKQENPMQTKLFTFFSQVLTELVANRKLLSINAHKYLMKHRKDIENISSNCSMDLQSLLQTMDEIMNDYNQFSKLIHTFRQMQDYLFKNDLSDRLKELGQQNDNWEAQGFANVKENYKDELQLLKLYQQKMEIILERKKSVMFQKIWRHFHPQYESIQSQKPLSIFDKIFDNMSHVWENFKQNLQNQTLKYQDLEWVFTEHSNDTDGIIKCLMNEMQYLFQDYNDEQRQKIVNDVEVNMRKAISLKEQLHSWIELKK